VLPDLTPNVKHVLTKIDKTKIMSPSRPPSPSKTLDRTTDNERTLAIIEEMESAKERGGKSDGSTLDDKELYINRG
jgi:hypothetical protein